MKLKLYFYILLIINSFLFANTVELTPREQDFLDSHKTIKVSNELDWPPFDFVKNGEPTGYSVDYLKLIAKKLNINIEWINGYSWKELLVLAENKEIDLIHSIVITKERQEYLNFSDPYFQNPRAIFKKVGTPPINGIKDLYSKKVAVIDNYTVHHYLEENFPNINLVIVQNSLEGLTSVLYDKADAYIDRLPSVTYQLKENNITGLEFASLSGISDLDSGQFHIAVRNDWDSFTEIINKAIKSIQQEELDVIARKWGFKSPDIEISNLQLTEQEKEWIVKNPIIRVHNEKNWAPFDFNKSGRPQGFSIDYITLLAETVGINIEFTTEYDWGEIEQAVQNNDLDIILNIVPATNRQSYLNFTKPYLDFTRRLYIRTEDKIIKTADDLRGKTIAYVGGVYNQEIIKSLPGVQSFSTNGSEESILALSSGKADVLHEMSPVINYISDNLFLTNIKYGGNIEELNVGTIPASIGVRKDLNELLSILNKGMDEITDEQLDKLNKKWLEVEPNTNIEKNANGSFFNLIIIFVVISGLLFFIFNIYRLQNNDQLANGKINIKKMKIFSIISLSISVTIVLLLSITSLRGLYQDTLSESKEKLELQLTTVNKTLDLLISNNLSEIEFDSHNGRLIELTEELIQVPFNEMTTSKVNKELYNHIKKEMNISKWDNFYLLDSDSRIISSTKQNDIGTYSYLVAKDYLRTTFLPPKVVNGMSYIHYISPVFDVNSNFIALLVYQEETDKNFSRICQLGRYGKTGETYAVNTSGDIISKSRFSSQYSLTLKNKNILKENVSGNKISEYLDYRDIQVFGTWLWSDFYDFGLVAEVDVLDALSGYNSVKRILITILAIVLSLSLATTIFSFYIGIKATTSLKKSNDDLEEKILDRTNELVSSNQLMTFASETAKLAHWTLDLSTNNFTFNDMFYHLIGTTVEEQNGYIMSATKFIDIYPLNEYKELLIEKISTGYESKQDYFDEFEYKGTKSNGVIQDTFIRYIVNHDINGKALSCVGIHLDITEQKKQDEELRKNQSFLNRSLKLAKMGGWEFDVITSRVTWTDELYALHDIEKSMILEEPDRDWVGESLKCYLGESKDMVSSAFNQAITNGIPYDLIINFKSWSGRIFWARTTGEPIFEGDKIVRVVGNFWDIDDQRKADIALEENKKFLEAIINNSESLIYAKDIDGRYLMVNTNWEEIFKRKRTEVVGKNDIEIFGNKIGDSFGKSDLEVIRTRKTIRLEEKNTINGFERASLSVKFPIYNKNGNLSSIASVSTDMTELIFAKEKAIEAVKVKSDFLANMSHEIRTPMNAIIGLSNLILKTDLSDKQSDYINKINGSSKNLLGIINDILDFSKIEAGKLNMEEIELNIHSVFEDLGHLITEKANDKNLELVFFIDTTIPLSLIGDPLRLGQVLLNLANNSIKFTEEGEVLVQAIVESRNEKSISIRFEVTDTGIGLSSEQQNKLFQAFSQADTSTTRKYGGTGLGLSISKKLVELMKGNIGVKSLLGQGSTFYFTSEFEISDIGQKEIVPNELKKLTILVVEDNKNSRDVLVKYIKDFSMNVIAVNNGLEAIDYFRDNKEHIDIVLIDYKMPGLNGFETSIKINELIEVDKLPKYILISGFNDTEIEQEILKYNFFDSITKPINQSILLNSIMNCFGFKPKTISRSNKDKLPEGFDKIRGAKILLTEDNEINQQIAIEILEAEGFYVDVANNGQEAVEKTKSNIYDLVLMDLQMPIKDGYEATKEIRTYLDDESLPIVAMTADAMTGVRHKVIDIGMNDYITKPIDIKKLWYSLMKWIKKSDRELPLEYNKTKNNSQEIIIPKIEGIDTIEGLNRIGGNSLLYKKLIIQFFDDYKDFYTDIIELVNKGLLDEAIRLSHSIKGVAGNIGAKEFYLQIIELEKNLKDGVDFKNSLETSKFIMNKLTKDVENSRLLINEGPKIKVKELITEGEITNKLNSVKDLLSKRKPKPAKEIIQSLLNSDIEISLRNKLNEVATLMNKYKMKDALNILD